MSSLSLLLFCVSANQAVVFVPEADTAIVFLFKTLLFYLFVALIVLCAPELLSLSCQLPCYVLLIPVTVSHHMLCSILFSVLCTSAHFPCSVFFSFFLLSDVKIPGK